MSTLQIEVMSMSFKLTWRSHIVCNVIAAVMALLIKPTMEQCIENYIMEFVNFISVDLLMVGFYISILLLMIPISIVHESLHGIIYRLFGGKVKYGFKGLYAYTLETSGLAVERVKFLIVLLTPLSIISLLSLLLPTWLGGMVFILNLLGASGDIYMSLYLATFSHETSIIDRAYGFDVVNY
jgi:hypothetical protein